MKQLFPRSSNDAWRKDVITALNGFPVKGALATVQFGLQVRRAGKLMGMSVYVICFLKRFERPEIVNSCCCLPGNVVHYGRGCNPLSEAIWHLLNILMC